MKYRWHLRNPNYEKIHKKLSTEAKRVINREKCAKYRQKRIDGDVEAIKKYENRRRRDHFRNQFKDPRFKTDKITHDKVNAFISKQWTMQRDD